MGVYLVYSGTDAGFRNFESVPPVGLIALYSALPDQYKEKTTFHDGNLTSVEEIQRKLIKEKPEIVGISTLTFGYNNALAIAETAKSQGSLVVLGGRHATDVLPNIHARMVQRPFDYIVSGEGEHIFARLVQDFYERGVILPQQNLFGKETQQQVVPERKLGFDKTFPVLDYSVLSDSTAPERYMERLERIGILKNVKMSMPIISQRGCAYMTAKVHCKFCSIPAVNPRLPYQTFGKSLENLIRQTQSDHVWITDGDFTASSRHVEAVGEQINQVKERTGTDFVIYCFTRADDLLREGMIDRLYALGVRAVFIGYEHGNNELLKNMSKHTTREQNVQATKQLAEKGIEVSCAGIVLGTPGETKKTLEDVLSFAEELVPIGNVRSIFPGPLYPFPGAPYWNPFLEALHSIDPKLSERIRNDDILNQRELIVQFQRVAHLMEGGVRNKATLEQIFQTRDAITGLFGHGIQFMEGY